MNNLTIIAAVAGKRMALGNKGQLLYHIPEDMKRFRDTTMGNTIIMGSRTFNSLPNGPLPGRKNIVLSRFIKEIPGCEVFNNLKQALDFCRAEPSVFIIGGGLIYTEALPYTNTLLLTEIDEEPVEADTFFPNFRNEFRETDRERRDGYSFVRYVRI